MKVIFFQGPDRHLHLSPHDVYIFGVKMSAEVDDGSPDSFPAYHVLKLPAGWSVIPGVE